MIRYLLPALLFCSLISCGDEAEYQAWLANDAQAADQFCGVDTDFSGTASNPCPAPDADHDGYPSSNAYTNAVLGSSVDCDDTNWWIQPGFEDATGCSAGNYRTCQADGTWTSCSAISGFTCNTAAGATYWVDDAETDCSGTGLYGDPEDWRCWFSTGMSGYHAPGDGDCIVFQPGTYSSTWSDGGTTRQFYLNNKDGTITDPIVFRSQPGAIPGYTGKVLIQGAGTSPTPVFPWFITLSNYTRTLGFEFSGTGGYNTTGIILDGSVDPQVYLNYVHDIDGIEDNNVSCIKCQVDDTGCYVHHNIVGDCYERADASAQNNVAIRSMDDLGYVRFLYNVVVNTSATGAGLDCKHADDAASYLFFGNFVKNVIFYGIGSENKDTVVKNNWVKSCDEFAFTYKGIGDTAAWFKDSVWSYNTVEQCGFMSAPVNSDDMVTSGHTLSGVTTILTAQYNITADDYTAFGGGYNTGDCGTGIYRQGEYSSDADYTASRGKFILGNNVWYNSGSNLCWGDYGDNGATSLGTNYTSLASWQAAGYDSGSVNANPSLDSDGISGTYSAHGWRAGEFTSAAGTVQGSGGKSARASRGR